MDNKIVNDVNVRTPIDKNVIMRDPIYFTAFGFGLGFMPVAPGTYGTLLGVLIYLINYFFIGINGLALVLILAVLGVYICGKTALYLNHFDHPGIVWDEVVGFLITMLFVPFDFLYLALGFVLFRFFDILKPWPINLVDREIKGGIGIMLDDVLAGIFANLTLCLILYFINFL